ncbi:glycosyl hydrolase family 38 [Singulisphaera sp. PoT]|uniref:glycosyl hydrolase family 38 n=1 Tax=Singulisphaera sp. PoT TaxID=3411797 RepID=UPI003BF554C1
MSDGPPVEPESETPPVADEPTASPPAWTFVSLIGEDSTEPSTRVSDYQAEGIWVAVSAPWHPALLAVSEGLPRIEPVTEPSTPAAREVRIIAEGWFDKLPRDYQSRCDEAGAILVRGTLDRETLVKRLLEQVNLLADEETWNIDEAAETIRDFMVLGSARWWIRDLTVAMNHADCLDHESLTRETKAGALAWQGGDLATAKNRLRAGFELLTQARERYYPLDAYLIDITLLDASSPPGVLHESLKPRAPITFMGPAEAIERLGERDPDDVAMLREAITEGWADVVGGSYAESDEPLAPFESILWQFRHGAATYRKYLDERNVETIGRRRFALYPQLPQVTRRFGFRFGVHIGLDQGRFPVRSDSKQLWESFDGTSLETLTKLPMGADRALGALQVPWRLAATMKDDHVATLPLIHWPDEVAPWYRDFRRISAYSPVLARWVTLNDFFHQTDRPYDPFRPEHDSYITPYLEQAVGRADTQPISRRVEHAALRARFDAIEAIRALAVSISTVSSRLGGDHPSPGEIENAIETGKYDVARAALGRCEPEWASTLTRAVSGSHGGARPGYLVLNPLGVARRVAVLLPDAALDLRPEGPLRASQFTEEGVWAVVELPAFGYAWVPRESNYERPPAPIKALSAGDHTLHNESMTVQVDPTTGGIRGVRSTNEQTARIGQQLVITGGVAEDGSTIATRMVCESFEVEYGGPALVQAVSKGGIHDPRDDRRLASFQQRYRLWSGRPTLDLQIKISDLDVDWFAHGAEPDPWYQYLACRWAWPDPNSMIRRSCFFSPEITEAERPETPDSIDISTRRQRTALLFGGLAHHLRHGPRMLDTLLIAGRESERTFNLGVALDLEHPFHASTDFVTPAYAIKTDAGIPRSGPTGWIFDIDNKAIAVTRLEYVDSSNDGRGWGVVFHLVETSGRAARCRLRIFRDPVWASQVDFNNEIIMDLTVDGSAVLVDLTPHEMARVDVTIG